MSRNMKMVGFTVPPAMAEELERMAEEEQRTKSELFREMFRMYRTYRKEIAQDEEERLLLLVQQALREAREHPMTEEEREAVEKALVRYGARKANELGITNEEDVDRIVYEARKRRRGT